jgi:hypothetical protein
MSANAAYEHLARAISIKHRQQSHRITGFFLAAIIIVSFPLLGCGGGVSTTDVQPPSVQPGAGTGTEPGTGTVPGTGSATVIWTAPSTNEDGTPITALGGYKVYYGTTPGVYTSQDVGYVGSYQVVGLTKGQLYYFTVTAYDGNGIESDYANVVSKLIL